MMVWLCWLDILVPSAFTSYLLFLCLSLSRFPSLSILYPVVVCVRGTVIGDLWRGRCCLPRCLGFSHIFGVSYSFDVGSVSLSLSSCLVYLLSSPAVVLGGKKLQSHVYFYRFSFSLKKYAPLHILSFYLIRGQILPEFIIPLYISWIHYVKLTHNTFFFLFNVVVCVNINDTRCFSCLLVPLVSVPTLIS